MLLLIFTGYSPKDEFQLCQLSVKSVDVCFESLTNLTNEGWLLISAVILDNGLITVLPVAAFDGQPIEPGLSELQSEWETLLNRV